MLTYLGGIASRSTYFAAVLQAIMSLIMAFPNHQVKIATSAVVTGLHQDL